MKRVHFILDEAASLSKLEAVDDAVDKYRGYGVRLLFIYQDMAQVKKCFPEGQEQTLLGNCTQVFFGVNENATADYVSTRLGDTTIVVESGGWSSGTSNQHTRAMHASSSSGSSTNSSHNWQMQARRLLKSEEVMNLPPTTAITFAPGVRPICTQLLRYYEEPRLGRRYGWFLRSAAACLVLAASVAICGATVGAAAMLTMAAEKQLSELVVVPDHVDTTKRGLHRGRGVRSTNRY